MRVLQRAGGYAQAAAAAGERRERKPRVSCACVGDVNAPLSPYFRRWRAKKQSALDEDYKYIRFDVARSVARNYPQLFSPCTSCSHGC